MKHFLFSSVKRMNMADHGEILASINWS